MNPFTFSQADNPQAALAQVADGSAGWPALREKLDPPGAERAWRPLRGPFWEEAALAYDRVRGLPTANKAEGFTGEDGQVSPRPIRAASPGRDTGPCGR